jgi:alpha-glucosidase (family GH31 glycosyl hydrolase)
MDIRLEEGGRAGALGGGGLVVSKIRGPFVLALAALLAQASAAPPLASGPWGARDPVADADAVVTAGSARFTILTDRLLRMEWSSETGDFEDRATMAIINRHMPVPDFTTNNDGTTLTISTTSLKLTWSVGEAFSADTLSVASLDDSSAFESWAFGQADPGNLLGTIRTLDGEDLPTLNCSLVQSQMNNQCGWDDSDCQCEWGVVGREGWALVDDSANYALSDESDFWDGPNVDAVDLYFFGHGHDYKGALKDFVAVGGSVALPPRHAVGVWFTRWYDFTQGTAEEVVRDFERRSLPLDVLVLDMNWHLKNDWTGYSFDQRLYPHREDLFKDLHDRGLLAAGNIHDADGVGNFEDAFGDLCAALDLDASAIENVPYNISDEAAQNALEDSVMLPLEGDEGFDFWWIDWQQGEAGYGAPGGKMNPTIWTAHQRSTDKARRNGNNARAKGKAKAVANAKGSENNNNNNNNNDDDDDDDDDDKRAMVLARWGGLGGHRYQVGFSGDVKDVNWATLSYQPYFSTTAANVAFGFWSHDITGPAADEELYVRWLQWGAHSGVLRMHDRGESAGPCNDEPPSDDDGGSSSSSNLGVSSTRGSVSSSSCFLVRPWEASPASFDAMREAVEARGRLLPYLYTALRAAHDEGLGLLRPLYYEHPEEDMAYLQSVAMPQYYLGPDMIVSPVVAQLDAATGLASQPLWVPPGTFLERATGLLRTGASSSSSSSGSSSNTCGAAAAAAAIDCATSENYNEEQCLARGCCWDESGNDKKKNRNKKGNTNDTATAGGAPWCYFSDEMAAAVVTKQADLAEVPVLVRAGAILVEAAAPAQAGGLTGRAARPYDSLSLTVFLGGAEEGSTSFYEDDGTTTAYVGSPTSYAFTNAKWKYDSDASSVTVTLGAAAGADGKALVSGGGDDDDNDDNDGFLPVLRDYEIRFANSPPPADVTVQGQPARAAWLVQHKKKKKNVAAATAEPTWYYDGAAAELVVRAPSKPTASAFEVVVTLALPTTTTTGSSSSGTDAKADADALLSGVKGALRRAVQAKEVLNEARACPGEATGETAANGFGATQRLAATGSVLRHHASKSSSKSSSGEDFWDAVRGLPQALSDARAELDAVNSTALGASEWRLVQAKAMLQVAAEDLAL